MPARLRAWEALEVHRRMEDVEKRLKLDEQRRLRRER
jgi:hypothetical protein